MNPVCAPPRATNPAPAPLPTQSAAAVAAPDAPVRAERIPRAGRMVLALLQRIQGGHLTLITPGGQTLHFGRGQPHATLQLHDWRVCRAALTKGDIGFAQSWIEGDWHTDDLPTLLELLARNRAAIEQAVYGSLLGSLIYRFRHALRRNDRRGSRRNIHAHYDLGNAFYAQWLDPSMSYSSALFGEHPERSLEAAQDAKYQRILDILNLPAGAHVLEIGCGWGGFAECAARRGLRVTGLTLSTEQRDWAQERMRAAGLSAQVAIRLEDYRDTTGRFDAVVSIEMFEAVGQAYWPTYFKCVADRLAPGAQAVIQTITIAEPLFERYRRGTDFIQQYIFPGGMLPSPHAFTAAACRAGLAVTESWSFGQDYARTLAHWRAAFLAAWPTIAPLGFDTRFARTWEFYLAYCQAGFASRNTDVVQVTLRAPG